MVLFLHYLIHIIWMVCRICPVTTGIAGAISLWCLLGKEQCFVRWLPSAHQAGKGRPTLDPERFLEFQGGPGMAQIICCWPHFKAMTGLWEVKSNPDKSSTRPRHFLEHWGWLHTLCQLWTFNAIVRKNCSQIKYIIQHWNSNVSKRKWSHVCHTLQQYQYIYNKFNTNHFFNISKCIWQTIAEAELHRSDTWLLFLEVLNIHLMATGYNVARGKLVQNCVGVVTHAVRLTTYRSTTPI